MASSPSTVGTEDGDTIIMRLEARVADLERTLETSKRGYESALRLEKKKNGELNAKVKGLMNTIMMCDGLGNDLMGRLSNKKLNSTCGKDMSRRLKDFVFHAKEQVWRKYKVLPKDWWVWKSGERDLSIVMMKKVTLVEGEVRPVFWKTIGVKVLNKTWTSSRSYCVKRLRCETEGKFIGMRRLVHIGHSPSYF